MHTWNYRDNHDKSRIIVIGEFLLLHSPSFRRKYLVTYRFSSNLVYKVMCMESVKHVNLVQILYGAKF